MLPPRPELQKQPDRTPYLDAVAEFMHGHRKKTIFFLERLDRLARELSVERSDVNVLDLGCGNGTLVSFPVAEAGFDVLGVDVHEPSIQWAREHNRLGNARFRVGDADEGALDGRFDAVILSDVLEHLHDPARVLQKARELVGDLGIVLVSIPNGFGPFELEQRFARTRPGMLLARALRRGFEASARARRRCRGLPWPPENEPVAAYNVESGHVQHFTEVAFQALVAAAGLRVVARANGALMGGDLTYFAFYTVPRLVPMSLRAADRLPARLVSTWYFELRVAY